MMAFVLGSNGYDALLNLDESDSEIASAGYSTAIQIVGYSN